MKRTIQLLLLATALPCCADAQSVGPATINAAGHAAVIGTNEFDWSVGEMTMVSTFATPGIVITQGTLQPATDAPNSITENRLRKQLLVFPNPATTVVNIQYSCEVVGTLSYKLMDMNGKVIAVQEMPATPGTVKGQVAVAELACATYMLEVAVSTDKEHTQQTTYQIQKLK